MSDETLTCKVCGAELEGRDVYEGICKSCREEAILGSAAPPPKPKPRKQAAAKAAQGAAGSDAIAIETDVDVEADTREIPGEEPASPRDFAVDASEGTHLGGLNIELPPSEKAEPQAPAPPADPDVIAFDLGGNDSAPAPVTPPNVRPRPFLAPREAPARTERGDVDPRDAERPPKLQRPVPLAPKDLPVVAARREPLPNRDSATARPERPAPTPPPRAAADEPAVLKVDDAQAPPPKPADDMPTLIAIEDEREKPAAPQPAPEAPPRRRGAAAPAPQAPAPASLGLEADRSGARTLARLAALEEQVQRLERLAGRSSGGASGRGFGFGFRAFFGFLMGLGVLGVVVVLLMAVVGLVFYPPAFELLRRAFTAITGGE